MILRHSYGDLGEVVMPAWQCCTHAFDPSWPVMEAGFEDCVDEDCVDVVAALVDAADVRGTVAYMTVDEKIVAPQMAQRRPGAHVEGRLSPR